MAEAWRTISVALEADTARYQSQMASASKTTARLGADTSKLSDGATKSSGIWSRAMGSMSAATVAMGTAVGLGTVQIATKFADMGRAVWDTGTMIQASTATLTGLYQDAGLAAQTMDDLKRAAAPSTIDFSGWASLAETLAYAGTQGPRAVGVIENLSLAVEGAGGSTENLDSIGEALLKIVNNGKATRREILQISNATFPIFDSLSAHMGVTVEELNGMISDGLIGINEVLGAIESGSGEFFKMQAAGAEQVRQTWEGTWKRWKDQAQVALGSVIADLLPRLTSLLQNGADVAGDFFTRLSGAWDQLASAGGHLVSIVRDLWDGIQPVAAIVAQAFGAAVIGTLTAFAAGLEAVTGWVSQYGDALKIAGMLLAGAFIVSKLAAAGLAIEIMVSNLRSVAAFRGTSTAQVMLERIGFGAEGAVGGVDRLKVSLGGLARMVAPIAALTAITVGLGSLSKASDKAKRSVDDVNGRATGRGFEGLRDAINESSAAGVEAANTLNSYGNTANRVMHGVWQSFSPAKDTLAEATKAYDEHLANNQKLIAKQAELDTTVNRLRHTYGLTRDQVVKLIESDEELNLATASTSEVTASFEGSLERVASMAGVTKENVGDLAGSLGLAGDAFEAVVDDANKFRGSVEDAVRSYLDLAQVKELESGADLSVSVAQLQGNMDKIRKFYEERLTGARQFAADITEATAQGYDPTVITQLISAGPETAGPILRSLVAGYSDEMKFLVNTAGNEMQQLAYAAGESARAIFLATHAETDALLSDLPKYQEIVNLWAAGMEPPEIAVQVGLDEDPDEFNRLLRAFGNESIDPLKVEVAPEVEPMAFDDGMTRLHVSLTQFAQGNYSAEVLADTTRAAQSMAILDQELNDLTERRVSQVDAEATPAELAVTDDRLEVVSRLRKAHFQGVPIDAELVQEIFDQTASTRPSLFEALTHNEDYVAAVLNGIAEPRPADINAEAKGTAKASSDIDGVANKPRTASVHVRAETSGFSAVMNSITNQYRELKFHAKLANTPTLPPALAGAYRRFGGFHSFATGGFSPLAFGGVTRTPMVAWGEHSTGGEAFVPRLGISDTRAKKILDVAAGWHGMQVVPAGQLRGLGGGAPVVNVTTTINGASGGAADIAAQVGREIDAKLPAITRAVAEARGQSKAVTGR